MLFKTKCKLLFLAGSLGIDFRKESKNKAYNIG